MAADIFAGRSIHDPEGSASTLSLSFDDNGYYWHLYPYFESAKLVSVSADELIDLYGAREIDGYELARLRENMLVAANDLQWRGDTWEVVTGWNEVVTASTEVRRIVQKTEIIALIGRLVALIDHCQAHRLKLCVFGD